MSATLPGNPRLLRCLALLLPAALAACSSSSKKAEQPPVSTAFTLHYHRPLGDYAGWTVETTVGAVETSVAASSTDGFGAVYALTLQGGATSLVFSLKNGTQTDAAGALAVDVSGSARLAYVFSGSSTVVPRALPAIPGASQVALYYTRADTDYAGWGLHLWGDQAKNTTWGAPLQPTGSFDADLGSGFLIDITRDGPVGNCQAGQVCVIVHKGDTKDPGPDMSFDPAALGNIVFVTSGSATISSRPRKVGALDIAGAAAHLLARDTLVWDETDAAAATFELRWSRAADIKVNTAGTDVVGGSAIPLAPNPAGISAALQALVPHLKTRRAFSIAVADQAALPQALTGQLVAVARRADGSALAATAVQIPLVLDDLYAYDGPLGATFSGTTPTIRLWAPTVQAAPLLHVFDDTPAHAELAGSPFTMAADPAPGVWTYTGPAAWYGMYYRYELTVYHPTTGKVEDVTVTDPYAANLSPNGLYAQIVDLADPALKPAGWDALAKPPLAAPEDIVIYESHIRDFSATDATVPAAHRGKYLAFADASDGTRHLADLAAAGLTHVHLLPAFDIATVDEDPANRVDVDAQFGDLCARNPAVPTALCGQFAGQTVLQAIQSFAGDSDQQQAIAGYMRALDSFNWGYDPFHYGAPEGSYASTAEGTAKIVEFRQMVMGLANLGLRVVMDVVYNHTNAAGVGDKSVLDKVVPGYYHRLNPDTGYVETSSCCANTATEHHMMGRLMDDTLVRWARDYKVDGFRFDLMGLHMKADVLAAQAALAALTPGTDGVDGSKIYLYGEGWNMGELQNNVRGLTANQANMAGTGIGTFNDRIRDYVRGGGPFDNGAALRAGQGFATGLCTDPNEASTSLPTDCQALIDSIDRIKVSMAGNLKDFRLVTAAGTTVGGGALGYNGQHSGYTLDPQEVINYVSAHDNQVLFDIIQHKLPTGRSMADRVRDQNLAEDTVLLGEGIPFVHMGDDLLRSKSMDKNSYDSGDWFNRVDWTGATNGWRSGLPSAGDNQANWPVILPVFADASIAPSAADIAAASAHFQEMLRVRKSSPLFRLATGADVKTRVDFLNYGPAQVPGVIVMTITDGTCAGADLDPGRDALVVILNADAASHTMTVPGASGFALHPVLAASADPVVRTAAAAGADFTVPARTSAVFELPQAGAQGAGLPCNTR
ncbi:MAG TPA: pullulanase-type alpha-1,6-glucosidase [Anaeromyxobacteraceae bacterium]|nr:pullulanase-type alpha-1,6-glucosidase [Anaeromyxobacteraceae bacterium]